MTTDRYTVEWLNRGSQPRPYADHIWEFLITAERDMEGQFEPFPESWAAVVKQTARGICHWDEDGDHWSKKLEAFGLLPDGRWRVVVTEAFTD